MDQLLNVREAARLLKVSQMTIRRWTNAGLLPCYRIGPKRERRFRLRDLEEYLRKGASSPIRMDMPEALTDLKIQDGSHVAHLYAIDEEALDMAVFYLKEGIEIGQTTLIVAPETRSRIILDALARRGINVWELQRSGRLHLDPGRSTPPEHASLIASLISGSRNGFRLLGEMLWTKARGWSAEQIETLERMSNLGMPDSERIFLCQYDLRKFSGSLAMMAVETHPHVIYKGILKDSPFFRKP